MGIVRSDLLLGLRAERRGAPIPQRYRNGRCPRSRGDFEALAFGPYTACTRRWSYDRAHRRILVLQALRRARRSCLCWQASSPCIIRAASSSTGRRCRKKIIRQSYEHFVSAGGRGRQTRRKSGSSAKKSETHCAVDLRLIRRHVISQPGDSRCRGVSEGLLGRLTASVPAATREAGTVKPRNTLAARLRFSRALRIFTVKARFDRQAQSAPSEGLLAQQSPSAGTLVKLLPAALLGTRVSLDAEI